MGRIADRLFWTEEAQSRTDERFRRLREDREIRQGYKVWGWSRPFSRRWFIETLVLYAVGVGVGLSFGVSIFLGVPLAVVVLSVACTYDYRQRKRFKVGRKWRS